MGEITLIPMSETHNGYTTTAPSLGRHAHSLLLALTSWHAPTRARGTHPVPCTLYPIPYTLYPIPYTLSPVPYTLYPISCTLYPIPCTLYPIPYTLYPIPYTLYPTPYTLYPIPYTLYPIPYIRNNILWLARCDALVARRRAHCSVAGFRVWGWKAETQNL
jgi:hypothetical protein